MNPVSSVQDPIIGTAALSSVTEAPQLNLKPAAAQLFVYFVFLCSQTIGIRSAQILIWA